VIRRIIAMGIGLSLISISAAWADEVGGEDIVVPRRRAPAPATTMEQPVTAPPPAWVELERTSVAAGLGVQWGSGTLQFEGRNYGFSVTGVSVGDLGAAKLTALGRVHHLDDIADFEGTYVAVGAGIAAGPGAAAATMRNEHGVVITLRAASKGAQLTLGTEGLRIALD
jgi:hypothetical protein